MDHSRFAQIIDEQVDKCREVLVVKAAEYATEDRLHNFKVAAEMQGCSTDQALAGMMAKHTVSIYDMTHSGHAYSPAQWDEKITDHLNYLLLLKAIVEERFDSARPMEAMPTNVYTEAARMH